MNIITKETFEDLYNLSFFNECSVEKSKDNKNILKVIFDNKEIYIGSKYLVQRDIDLFLRKLENINLESIIIIFGLGCGEHISELLDKISHSNKVIIFEPNISILKSFVDLELAKKILSDNRVFISKCDEQAVNNVLLCTINEININNIEYVHYANYDNLYELEYNQLYSILKQYIYNKIIELNTSLKFSKKYFESYMSNLDIVVQSCFINSIKNKYKGYPAVIVSAGPSLDKNIHLLKDVQDKIIIIAGGRTLKPLLNIGIKPDFICSFDLQGYSYDLIKEYLDSDVPLVYNELSNVNVVHDYKSRKIYFTDIMLGGITDKIINYKVDGLFQGGSVAHICMSFAEYLGCNPIIFIGQDLAYTNNKLHADSAKTFFVDPIDKLYVDDINGEKVLTTSVFNYYRKRIEEFIGEKTDRIFINATEGGANIKGTEIKTLDETIKDHCENTIDKNINYLIDNNKQISIDIVILNMKKRFEFVKEIKKLCNEGINYCQELYDYYDKNKKSNTKNVIKKLNKIDTQVNKNIEKIEFMKMLFSPIVAKVLMNETFKEKFNETETERNKRIFAKNINLYQGLIEIIDYAEPLINKCINNLENLNNME